MDPSRTALIAQRAGALYRETVVTQIGGDPAIALVFGEADEPAVFYRIDNVPNDLFGACRAIYWTAATAALLCADLYESIHVEGMPDLKDEAELTKADLPALFRARDPRVREAVQVDVMGRGDQAMVCSARLPYRADGDRVEWIDNPEVETDPPPEDDEHPQLLARLMRAAFEMQATRPEAVEPLDVLQCGLVAGLDTVVPALDGGYQLHPFGSQPTHGNKAEGRSFSFSLPDGGVGFALPLD